MSDKALPMTAANRQAILEGRKTQTRRIIKLPDGPDGWSFTGWINGGIAQLDCGRVFHQVKPRYKVGDRCYIAESIEECVYRGVPGCICYSSDRKIITHTEFSWHWKRTRLSSRFMPKKYARTWVIITKVFDPHRVQDISEEDAKAEGYDPFINGHDNNALDSLLVAAVASKKWTPCKAYFARMWESIHGPGSWERNDWVLPIEFVVEPKEP